MFGKNIYQLIRQSGVLAVRPLRFIKFGLVGFLGMLVDFSVTWALKEKLSVNKYVSNATGFTAAVFFNYALNRVWTFQSHDQNVQGQLLKFFLVSLFGLLLNSIILYVLVSKRKMDFYLSKFLTICIVFVWNYLANSYFTFHN